MPVTMQNTDGIENQDDCVPHKSEMHFTTPSPKSSDNGSNSSGRYIPPQRRGILIGGGVPLDGATILSPIIRPESAMSNATILTQPPMTPILQPATPALSDAYASNPFVTPVNSMQLTSSVHGPPNQRTSFAVPSSNNMPPSGIYRYGVNQLAQGIERFDFGVSVGDDSPGVPRYDGDSGSKRVSNDSFKNNTPTRSSGLNFRNGGFRPGFGNSPGVIGSGRPPKMQDFDVAAPTPRRSPSAADSVNSVALIDKSKAELLSIMIKNGLADDPQDVDYGNCGPSHRADEMYEAILQEPRNRRGRVAGAANNEFNSNSPDPLVRTSNIRGNPAAFITVRTVPLPTWFRDMEQGYEPVVEDLMSSLPIIEACRVARPSTAGVVRIRNVPYLSSKAEVVAFLGRNAQIVSQPVGTAYMGIHITMCRLSGKTLDCFVEVDTAQEAATIVNQFARRAQGGRYIKLGDRHVAVEKSSQAELMADLFPRAKNCTWYGPVPHIDTDHEEFYEGVHSMGFNGFLLDEDYAHMIKHVEMPFRGRYAGRCLVRPYECIIYTIHKFPWFAVEHVLIWERDALFKVALKAVVALMEYLRKHGGHGHNDKTKPTSITLKELTVAIFTCPGFTEMQKALVIAHLHAGNFGQYTVSKGFNIEFGGIDAYSSVWPFLVLCKKPGVKDELLEFFASLLREATRTTELLSITDLQLMQTTSNPGQPFGKLGVDYTNLKTLAEAGHAELAAVEKMLKLELDTQQARILDAVRDAPGHASFLTDGRS